MALTFLSSRCHRTSSAPRSSSTLREGSTPGHHRVHWTPGPHLGTGWHADGLPGRPTGPGGVIPGRDPGAVSRRSCRGGGTPRQDLDPHPVTRARTHGRRGSAWRAQRRGHEVHPKRGRGHRYCGGVSDLLLRFGNVWDLVRGWESRSLLGSSRRTCFGCPAGAAAIADVQRGDANDVVHGQCGNVAGKRAGRNN